MSVASRTLHVERGLAGSDLGRRPLRPWQAYVFATVVTAATLAVRLALDAPLGGQPTLVIFTVPIMLSAYAGGLYAGLLATALSSVAASYYLLPPIHSFAVTSNVERWQQFLVALAGVVISASNEGLHRARRQAEIATREHRHAELARQESEERYRAVVEWSPEALLVRRSATIVFVNPAAITMFGAASAADLVGRDVLDLMPADFDRTRRERVPDTAADGTVPLREERLVKLDGTGIDVEVQSTPIVYDGAPAILASLRDVTGRKRVESALSASEGRYRTLFERAPDGIVIADPAGYYIDTNAAMCRMIGYTRDEFLGLHSSDIVAPAEIPYIEAALGAIKAAADYQREWQFRRKDGSIFTAEVIATQMPDGNPMAMIRDLTERMQKEEELRRAGALQRAMEEASRLKTEFLANMSHELRTPLNAIISFAELMHRGRVGPVSVEHQEYLGDILTSSKHLLQLINDVLDLAKVESGKMGVRLESVDLVRLAHEVGDIVRGLAATGRLQVETLVDPAVATVIVDPARVKQILYNYVSNAIKFTPPGGRITIRIGPESPDLFRIDVEDTGVGIAAGDLDKLFVEFQQLDASAAKQYQGTGLGLALTKKLAEAHGGRVTVRSTPGAGSTFSVILPRVKTAAPSDEVAGPFIGLPAGNRTILVVDDDPASLKLASLVLRHAGYQPVCCADPAEALRMAEADPPGIVIVDLLMPGVDGFEFVSRFRAMPAGRDVPIIVWTVKDLDAAEHRRLQPSITGLVSKNAGGSNALVEGLRRLLLAKCAMPPGGDPQSVNHDRA